MRQQLPGTGDQVKQGRSRRGIGRFFEPSILVRFTNFGLGFVLTTLVVAIGATNTGNNGLYILLALFLSALVVSGVVSRRNVANVTATLDGPAEVFAGQPTRFTLRLKNDGRLPRRALLVKLTGAASPVLFARIGPGEEATRGVDLVFPRRGRKVIESLLVYSAYPIGLFRKGRLHAVGQDRVVYPAPSRVAVPRADPREAEGGTRRSRRRGRGAEVQHLRDAGFGDDPRDVHWPQTVRQGRFIIKERAADQGKDAIVLLETTRPHRPGPRFSEGFERAVSEAAGIILQLLARGDRVGLALGMGAIPPGSGPAHRRAMLAALALVEPGPNEAPAFAFPPGASLYRVRPVEGDVRNAAGGAPAA